MIDKLKHMETKVDPLKVLDLPQNYNKEMLREAYKRMALKAHPDKGGNEYLFKLLTQCYKYLSAELKKKEADKQFYELKKEFQNVMSGGSNKESKSSRNASKSQSTNKEAVQGIFYEGVRFDKDKFNKYFEDNKLKDEVYEAGYKEWMEKHNVKEAPKYRGSFNSSGFNNHFEKHAKVNSQNKQIMKYQEPEALVAVKRLGFTELGQDSIDDFSGENKSIKHLNYMDYKVAHTTNRIIDPSTVKRQGFNNIQELETARENVAYQMTEQEIVDLMKRQRLQKKLEEQRQANLQAYDQKVSQHYERLNGLLQMPQYR
jgi:curved DNA-binding protein CbpA